MNTFITLLKREWLEARTPFFWFQVGALALFALFGLLLLLISGTADVEVHIESEGINPITHLFINEWSGQDWQERMLIFRNLVTAPFYLIYLIAALFMLLGALYDERKDRSVLFWKSLPVTDLETVLAKLVMAAWIAPLVLITCALAAQLLGLAGLSIFVWRSELGDASLLWWHSGVLMGAFQLLLGFLIQGLWTLPILAYLLLVSVCVPRMALLWAVALPIIPILLEATLFQTRVLSTGIAKHIEPAALPNFLSEEDRIMPVVSTVGDQLALLINPDLWIGVVIGAAFLYAAARVRGINNEL
jgi:ABC-2 type transport system permease protein